MRRLMNWLAVLVLTIGVTAVPQAAAAQQSEEWNVTPAVGPPGARFAFMATGFDGDERVNVWVNTPTGQAMAIEAEELNGANDDGRADWYWTAPEDAQRGIWQMVARGDESNVQWVIPFEIRGEAAAETGDSNVTPAVGPPGARFAFVAFGFDGDERVNVWVNTPAGQPMAIEAEELNGANADGRADWYWTAPEDAQRGIWQMVARGDESDVERVITFEIR